MVELTADQQDFVDELIRADSRLWAIQFYSGATDCGLKQAIEAVDDRKQQLGLDFSVVSVSRAEALDRLDTLKEAVVVLEASWDGDDGGWFIRLSAITKAPSPYHARYTEHSICFVRGLENQVDRAVVLGWELAEAAGVPFYLTSVAVDDTIRWWDTQPD